MRNWSSYCMCVWLTHMNGTPSELRPHHHYPGTVRRQLESDFNVDLSEKKAFIGEQVDLFLSELANEKKEEEPEDEEEHEVKEEEEEEEESEAEEDEESSGGSSRKRG